MDVVVIGLNYAPEPTGIAPYTAALCRGLAARGWRVRAITTVPHYPEWRPRPSYDRWTSTGQLDGVQVRRLRHYIPMRPSGLRRLLSEVSFGLRAALTSWGRPQVALFVSPGLFSTALVTIRARLLRLPTVVWVQDVYSLGIVETGRGARGGLVARFIRAVESTLLRSVQGVVVIHQSFADVVEDLGAAPSRVDVVRNWTHLQPGEHEDRALVRRRLGWAADESIVLHSGAMGHKQDLDNVIKAAQLADRREVPIRFVLMGDGSERTRLEVAAKSVKRIVFVDPVPDSQFESTLRSADVLLVNQHKGLRSMAVPSKLTSYFGSGRPVLAASDVESVSSAEIAAAGAGVRVEPADPAALLDAVLALAADPDTSEELGRSGVAYRQRVLSETVALDRFESVLRRAVSRRSAGASLQIAATDRAWPRTQR